MFLGAFLVATSVAQAMPYTCESLDRIQDRPVLRFRINPERDVRDKSGNTWRHYLIGVTPHEGFREIIYASGKADEKMISMTFVKDSFVLGSVGVESRNLDGIYEGEARIGGFAKGRTLQFTCVDDSFNKM